MELLSLDEVAERMGIGPTGVRDLVRSGHLLTTAGEEMVSDVNAELAKVRAPKK